MYDHIKFAEKSNPWVATIATTEDFKNTVLATCLKTVVTPVRLKLGELKVNFNGTAVVEYPGGKEPLTQVALEGLCKVLSIPDPFRRYIPIDLLLYNIESLQVARSGQEIDLLVRPQGGIANIVSAPYDEIPYLDILSVLLDSNDLQRVEVSESLMKLSFKLHTAVIPNMPENDPWHVGVTVVASLNKLFGLHMLTGLYRTMCENSYCMPLLGKARANYSVKDYQMRLLRFADVFKVVDRSVLNQIETNFSKLMQIPLSVPRFVRIINRLDAVLSSAETCAVLNITTSDKKELFAKQLERQAAVRKSRIFKTAFPEELYTNKLAYNVINDITAHGRKLGGLEGYTLEKFGGALIQDLILN